MAVVDASALVEYLIGTESGEQVAQLLIADSAGVHVPYLAAAEVISALRSLVARGELDAARAHDAVTDLSQFPSTRYPSEPFLERIWALRHSLSAYDAHYVALAESLGDHLITCDRRIERAAGPDAHVVTVR